MTAKYFIPALIFTAVISLTTPLSAVAAAPAWQVQQANMIYQNSGMINSEGALAGAAAQIGFDPKSPEDGSFELSFSTTGLFMPRDAMATRDPKKLQQMATTAGNGTISATRMERRGDTIGVTANMTINGQTHPVIFNMGVAEGGNDAGRSLRLTGQFMINRPAFATKDIGYIGPANIPVKFEVTAMTQAAAPAEDTAATDPHNDAGTAQAAEPGTQQAAPVPYAAQPRSMTEGQPAEEEKKENSDIGIVRSFGGAGTTTTTPGSDAGTYGSPSYGSPYGSTGGNTGYAAPGQDDSTSEVGKVRSFGGSQ